MVTQQQTQKNLYIVVDTFDGKTEEQIGTRLVDLHHPNTRDWTLKHQWWAMNKGHLIETRPATDKEVDDYVNNGAAELVTKFGDGTSVRIDKKAVKTKVAA